MELKAINIQKTYGARTVLDNVSFTLERGQKIGLTGYNGTGKSTLLKVLAQLIEPDAGEVEVRKGTVVGYMPQDTSLVSTETVRDYLQRVSGMAELEDKMALSSDALSEYERRDGYAFYHRVDSILAGFGLDNDTADRHIDSLSSGQKSKVFMAGVLLSDPDVLLLDEPTNNLDLPALIWLEDYLSRSDAASIIVSHDRLFLDRIVRKIFEIDWVSGTLTVTNGKYSDYLERKEKEKARQAQLYEAQQEEIGRLTEIANDKRAKALRGSRYMGTDNDKFLRGFKRDQASKSGKGAKVIEKRIEQMDKVERPIEREMFRIDIEPVKPEGSRDITLRDVIAGYGDNGFKVGPVSSNITYGSRVVILGLNGSGKSTLLKTIGGELPPLSGEVEIGGGLVVGNLMQEHDNLPRQESLKDFLVDRTGLELQDVYALAIRFGFRAEELEKKIVDLSPGGRARLLFAVFSALDANAILLDEPTNHLDLEALDALEEAVAHYQGTVILISHDRYFLEKFKPTDTYVLSNGKLSRQQSFEAYRLNAEREAKRLINML